MAWRKFGNDQIEKKSFMSLYKPYLIYDKATGELIGWAEAANECHARNQASDIGYLAKNVVAELVDVW